MFNNTDINYKIFRGFTLAEVLITLGVIGVVSAITMPTLIQKHQEQRTVAQLQKVYSTLSQAWQRMETEYGSIDTWGMENTNTGNKDDDGNWILNGDAQTLIMERLSQYLKTTDSCIHNESCNIADNFTLTGELKKSNSAQKVLAYLTDGTRLEIGYYSQDYGYVDLGIVLQAKKNVLGKNVFYFHGYPHKITPEGSENDILSFSEYCKPRNGNAGRGCTAWVLQNRNMDYLHCPDELSWNGKTKCK